MSNNGSDTRQGKLRIAFLVHVFPRVSETFILNQGLGLLERGHDVHVLAQHGGSDDGSVPLDRLEGRVHYLPATPDSFGARMRGVLSARPRRAGHNGRAYWRAVNVLRYPRKAVSLRLWYAAEALNETGPFDVIHSQFGSLGHLGMALTHLPQFTAD